MLWPASENIYAPHPAALLQASNGWTGSRWARCGGRWRCRRRRWRGGPRSRCSCAPGPCRGGRRPAARRGAAASVWARSLWTRMSSTRRQCFWTGHVVWRPAYRWLAAPELRLDASRINIIHKHVLAPARKLLAAIACAQLMAVHCSSVSFSPGMHAPIRKDCMWRPLQNERHTL